MRCIKKDCNEKGVESNLTYTLLSARTKFRHLDKMQQITFIEWICKLEPRPKCSQALGFAMDLLSRENTQLSEQPMAGVTRKRKRNPAAVSRSQPGAKFNKTSRPSAAKRRKPTPLCVPADPDEATFLESPSLSSQQGSKRLQNLASAAQSARGSSENDASEGPTKSDTPARFCVFEHIRLGNGYHRRTQLRPHG